MSGGITSGVVVLSDNCWCVWHHSKCLVAIPRSCIDHHLMEIVTGHIVGLHERGCSNVMDWWPLLGVLCLSVIAGGGHQLPVTLHRTAGKDDDCWSYHGLTLHLWHKNLTVASCWKYKHEGSGHLRQTTLGEGHHIVHQVLYYKTLSAILTQDWTLYNSVSCCTDSQYLIWPDFRSSLV